MIIDSHTHIFPPGVIHRRQHYLEADAGFAALYSNPKARMSTAEDLIDSMDRDGIDMSIACGFNWAGQELCREANDYMLDVIQRYPRRLAGLATLRPEAGDAALYELERCVKGGVKGIGEMRPRPNSLDNSFDSLWTAIAGLLSGRGLICLFHASEPVGHPYAGKGELTPQVLYPFITRHPGLKIVLAHWGGGLPFYALMPEVKKTLSSVWFDTAASPFLYDTAVYTSVVDAVGAGHILFGTDYPLMPQSRVMREINGLPLSHDDMEAILGLNAAALLEIQDV